MDVSVSLRVFGFLGVHRKWKDGFLVGGRFERRENWMPDSIQSHYKLLSQSMGH